ncbi:hypothetical protein [Mycobacterium intracellulare]|uniref:hypothetical protein n=1 Tax=Mycobacterium intracellulare TaxID=1767 RepID=UPI00191611A5|nr:hypothetical protein [Mycobacterium intracellulare]BCO71430.1 hypothetical protein MINTM008_07650 [Mycobacterium intracellulare]BCO76981.1 hypothetical protein MINTM009_07630 [Mycobacterium intracellulare]BCP40671.1 hypothetical protein MINTMi27_07640 [Mycobacterium intracellulare]
MAAPQVSDLAALTGTAISQEQGAAVLTIITAMASAYTRGQGFTAGVPNDEIRAVILTASARLVSNATGLTYSETEGPSAIEYSSAFSGWTLGELFVLNRYRRRAQ